MKSLMGGTKKVSPGCSAAENSRVANPGNVREEELPVAAGLRLSRWILAGNGKKMYIGADTDRPRLIEDRSADVPVRLKTCRFEICTAHKLLLRRRAIWEQGRNGLL